MFFSKSSFSTLVRAIESFQEETDSQVKESYFELQFVHS